MKMPCLLFAVIAVVGCVNRTVHEPVKPTELPKLNEIALVRSQASVGATTATGTSSDVATVEAPDGRLVAVKRPFGVRLNLGAETLSFDDPVRTTIEGNDVKVQGANRASTVALDKILAADVYRTEINGPVFLGVVVGTILAVTVGAFVLVGI